MSSIVGNRPNMRSARRTLVLVNVGSLLAQIVQVAGYPTLLTLTLARIDYPSWVIGTILASQWAAVLFLAPLVPKLMNGFGVRSSSQIGSAASLCGVAVLLASDSLWVVGASAVLMGAGLTVRWVSCDTWIVQAVEPRMRGRAIGIHETLMGLGIAIGPLLTLLWQGNPSSAVIVYGGLLLLSGAAFALAASPTVETDPEEPAAGNLMGFVVSALTLALVAALASGYVETAMVALLPLYLISFDYSAAHALLLLSVFGLGGTLLQAPLGWLADRWGFRAGQMLCLVLVIIGGLFLTASMSTPWVVAVTLFVWGGCVGGLNTLAVIEAGATLPARASGTGMALVASAYTLGGVVGPSVSGMTLHVFGGHGAILVIVAVMIVYGAVLIIGPNRRRRHLPAE